MVHITLILLYVKTQLIVKQIIIYNLDKGRAQGHACVLHIISQILLYVKTLTFVMKKATNKLDKGSAQGQACVLHIILRIEKHEYIYMICSTLGQLNSYLLQNITISTTYYNNIKQQPVTQKIVTISQIYWYLMLKWSEQGLACFDLTTSDTRYIATNNKLGTDQYG